MKRVQPPPCEVCGRKLTPATAGLCVDSYAAGQLQAKMEAAERTRIRAEPETGHEGINLGDVLTYEPVPWLVTCQDCPPHGYWIAWTRIDTPAKALARTLHLMDKTWLRRTNWQPLMYRLHTP